MEDNLKFVTAAPYLKGKADVSKIMLSIIVSLLPAVGFAIYKYRVNALVHLIVTVIVCVATDYLYNFFVKKRNKITDGSSVIIGIIIMLLLPAYAPYYVGVIGGIFAIVVVKYIMGDIANFYVNPAVAAKCLLVVLMHDVMQKYAQSVPNLPVEKLLDSKSVNTFNMMIGNVDGSMGEVCAIALLIGAVILVITGVADIYIPGTYILSFLIVISIFGGRGLDLNYLIAQLAGGGFLLVVWFIATDYKSSPITPAGQAVYGLILGILTGLVRVFGRSSTDIYFVLLAGNLLVPLIERFTIPKPFVSEGSKNI